MKRLLLAAAMCHWALAQPPAAEQEEIRRGLADANSSDMEVLRFIEKHLAAHPDTPFRPELEQRAALAAIALHDDTLIVRYGEEALARAPNDTQLLPAVTRSLLGLGSRAAAERALQYAQRTEALARQAQKDGSPGNVSPIEWRNRTDFSLNRALTDEARAIGMLGLPADALATAQRAFEIYPDAASAREIGYWFERLGKLPEAVRALADAFTIPDAHATDAERARDRAHLGDLYRQAKGSPKGSQEGLGDLCLEAYDRNAALLRARAQRLARDEPNSGRANPMEFTLSGLDGKSLEMASLKGKVVAMDLWATWCLPCREQHPLYEQVRERFRDNPAVVFLSIDADADRSLVKSFVTGMNWQGPVYFEDGLARAFGVDGLPATLVLDPSGRLFTRLNGYVDKARFVDLLAERIREALAMTPGSR